MPNLPLATMNVKRSGRVYYSGRPSCMIKIGPVSSKPSGCSSGQANPRRKNDRLPQAISREVISSNPAPTRISLLEGRSLAIPVSTKVPR